MQPILTLRLILLLVLPIPGLGQASSNISWVLEKLGFHPDFVSYGTQLRFLVTGSVPAGAATDLRVEINSASDAVSALFTICAPVVASIGSNLLGSSMVELNNQWIIVSTGQDYRNNRASLYIGNITNTGVSSAPADNQIVFEFTSKVLNSPTMASNNAYLVSFGARTSSDPTGWVGQAAYSWLNITGNTTGTPVSIDMSGPSSLMIGETSVFTVTFRTGLMLNQIILNVMAPMNSTEIMSICYVGVGDDTGSSFSCTSMDGNLTYANRLLVDPDSGEFRNAIATFDAGELINGASRTMPTSQADDAITFKIAAKMLPGSVPDTPYRIEVALQHNFAQFFVASADVTALAADWNSPAAASPTILVAQAMTMIRIGASTSLFLNVSLPRNFSANISVEVFLPFNNSAALMSFQRLRVLGVGRNMPCVFYSNKSLRTNSSAGDSNRDYAIFYLGVVSNIGIRSGLYDDTIAIEISAILLNHPQIALGGEIQITAGIRFGSATLASTLTYTVVTSQQAYPPSKLPQVTFRSLMSSGIIYNGTASAFLLEIYQPTGTQFQTMEVQIDTVMDNNRAVLAICDVQLILVGSHFVNISSSSLSVVNVSTADDGLVNTVIIRFPGGFLSNVGNKDYPWISESNTIRFIVLAYITPHYIANGTNLINSTLYWISCSIKNTPSVSFYSRVDLRYDPVTVFNSVTSTSQPRIGRVTQTPNSTVWVGGFYALLINMTSVPQVYGHYSISAASTDSSLSVCRISLSKRGRNVPCLGTMIYQNKSLFDNNGTSNQMIYLDLLNFANFGQLAQQYTGDDNSGLFDVVFQLKSGDTGVNFSATSSFSIGPNTVWTDHVNITANSTLPKVNYSPQFSISLRNDSMNLVQNGFHTVVVEGYIPVDTLGNYKLELIMPFGVLDRGKLHICSLRVVRAGWNLPCVNDSQMLRYFYDTYNNGTYDRAEIFLGPIQNIAVSGPIVQDDNKIEIEADIFVSGSRTTPGETLVIATIVNISNSRYWIGTTSLTVTNVLPSLISFNPSVATTPTPPFIMKIYEEKVITFSVSIPEGLTNVSVSINTSTRAGQNIFVLRDLNVTFIGPNFCCQNRLLSFAYSNESSLGNSQNDRMGVALGVLANSGVWRRYQWYTYSKDADVIRIEVKARLTDHVDNQPGVIQNIYCVLMYSGTTFVTVAPVWVNPYGSNQPALQIFQTELQPMPIMSKTPGTQIQLTISINHTGDSQSNAYNVQLYWYLPPALRFDAFAQSNPIPVTIQNNTGVSEGLVISIPYLAYTDSVSINVSVTVDPLWSLGFGSGVTFIYLIADAFYTGRNASVGSYSPTYRSGIYIYIPDCFDPLGMESGAIRDCQISSSGDLDSDTSAKSRYNSDKAWSTLNRGPPFYGNEFLTVNFGNLTRITAVQLQSSSDSASSRVDAFWLQRSAEGLLWFDITAGKSNGRKIYNVSYNGSSAYVSLGKAIVGRWIRLLPQTGGPSHFSRSLRVEFYGCQLTADTQPGDACDASWPPAPLQSRGYLVNPADGSLFVFMPGQPGGRGLCSRSDDFGTSWEPLDDAVSSVDFVQARPDSTQLLFGTGYDDVSRLSSRDGGWSWSTISDEEYTSSRVGGTGAVQVPWLDFSVSSPSSLFSTYGFGFNASHAISVGAEGIYLSTDGLNTSWALIAYWSQAEWN